WEGLYEVSDQGRVRSLPREVRREKSGPLPVRGQVLGASVKNGRHPAVQLRDTSRGRSRIVYVHRLVAEVCIPNPEGLPIVRHLDDNALNNRVENLAWGTQSDNAWDKVRNGRHHNQRKTHCPQGHPYSGSNLYVSRRGDGSTFRTCRACQRARKTKEVAA